MDSLYRAESIQIQEENQNQNQNQNSDSITVLQDVITRLTNENGSLHEKVKDLIAENFQIKGEFEALQSKALNIVKLPINRVKLFLALCQPSEENDDTFFYVKVEDGNMTRIVRSPKELANT